jgi:hypothetical protein
VEDPAEARGGAECAVTRMKLEGLVRNTGDAVPEVSCGRADSGFVQSSRPVEARVALPGEVARFFTAKVKALLPARCGATGIKPPSLLPTTYAPLFDRGLKYMVQFG